MPDTTGTTSPASDRPNRPIQITQPTAIGNLTVQYGYDLVGNRDLLVYPNGQKVFYAYDALNRLTDVNDWAGGIVSYNYDVASQLSAQTNSNGTSASFNYDKDGQLLTILHFGPGSSTLASFQYTYDPIGNRTSELSLDGTTSYIYDQLDRIATVK